MSQATNKLIDDIIELILGDMDCHHEVDHDEDGIHTTVDYSLNNEAKLRGMIGELIDKSIEMIQEPQEKRDQEEIKKLAADLSTKWYCSEYGGWSWKTADEVVEEFILWLYKNGGKIDANF